MPRKKSEWIPTRLAKAAVSGAGIGHSYSGKTHRVVVFEKGDPRGTPVLYARSKARADELIASARSIQAAKRRKR